MTVDFHAHMHPGADHGCKNSQAALEQLCLARDAGVKAVVTVSHYYPLQHSTRSYLESRAVSAENLNSIVSSDQSLPRVFIGSEVTLCPGLEKMERLREVCIDGTDCILIEMPFTKWDLKLYNTLEAIRDGLHIIPVLAHVDRYDANDVGQLLAHGFLGQLNLEAFSSRFGTKYLVKWAEKGYIAALGSDIHGVSTGYKYLEKARKALGTELWQHIMSQSSRLLGL